MAERIDGKVIAAEVLDKVKAETEKLVAETGVQPGIAVVIVGEDPASQFYVRSKGKMTVAVGVDSYSAGEVMRTDRSINHHPRPQNRNKK